MDFTSHIKSILHTLISEVPNRPEWGKLDDDLNLLDALAKARSPRVRYRDGYACVLDFMAPSDDDEGFWFASDRFVITGYIAPDNQLQSIELTLFESSDLTLDADRMDTKTIIAALLQAGAIEVVEID